MTPLTTPLGRAGVVIVSAFATLTCGMEMAARLTPFGAACCETGYWGWSRGLWLMIGETAFDWSCIDWDCEGGSGCDGDDGCCELAADTVGGRITPPENILI